MSHRQSWWRLIVPSTILWCQYPTKETRFILWRLQHDVAGAHFFSWLDWIANLGVLGWILTRKCFRDAITRDIWPLRLIRGRHRCSTDTLMRVKQKRWSTNSQHAKNAKKAYPCGSYIKDDQQWQKISMINSRQSGLLSNYIFPMELRNGKHGVG